MTTNPFAGLTSPPVCRPGDAIEKPVYVARSQKGNTRKRESRFATVQNPWSLSPTQFEMLRLLVSGLERQEVSDQLCMSVKTFDTHLHRAKVAMGVQTMVMAAMKFDRWSRGEALPDVEVVLRFYGGQPSVEMREVAK